MKKITLLIITLFLICSNIEAQTTVKYGADKAKSYITYEMSHPMHNWEATSKNVLSVLIFNPETKKIVKVAVSIPVSTFDSQNANRDSHMIEVLEGLKFPAVTFTSSSITDDNSKLTVTGELNFHGVTKSITIDANSKITDQGIEVTGSFIVKISDFKIENPSLMGIPTNDNIALKFFVLYNPK
ncbi:MAG: YceI family protein [Bacteroidia bacterium]|nr:YceI family protein [Bacteroidia bacterium]